MHLRAYFDVTDPDTLRTQLRRGCLRLAVAATLAVTVIFSIASENRAGIAVLWIELFPAFWIALRFICLIAWDTSFKRTSSFTISASPRQVLISCAIFSVPAIIAHSYAAASAFASADSPAGGAILFVAVPAYILIAFIGLVVGYLPILLIIKLVAPDAPNRAFENGRAEEPRADQRER
jgi:lysylphosphatidylglycerol synthetase-like protein (DUF2156 family)